MPQAGSFSTEEQRPWNKPLQQAVKDVTISPSMPSLAVGFTMLDADKGKNLRAKTYPDNVKGDGFKFHIDTWSDSKLYRGAATWFFPADCDYQTGWFDTQEDHPSSKPQQKTEKKITFSRAYRSAPEVVIWLNAVDISSEKNIRVNAFASDITADGFTIHIDTWSDTTLHSAAASWIAYPADKPGVSSGNFSTSDVHSPTKPQLTNNKTISFPDAKKFKAVPQVFAAINAIDMDRKANFRVKVLGDDITDSGFTWHIDSWADTVMYTVNAAYLAIDYPDLTIESKL